MSNEPLTNLVELLVENTEELVASGKMFICLDSDSNMPRLKNVNALLKSAISEDYYDLLNKVDK